MDLLPQAGNSLTPSQRQAIAARGNVLVMAGAGTGKTHTLVERCLDCLGRERAAIDEILVVTFTEAAAAEMRRRLSGVLERKAQDTPDDPHWREQLALFDASHIGTLHGFCFKLVREHFYELGLDPQISILDEGQARLLAGEVLDDELQEQYAGQDELAGSVQSLIRLYGGARDERIRSLVLQLHNYAQTRPDAEGWLARQTEMFSADEPAAWRVWLTEAIARWRDEWLPVLENFGAPVSDPARTSKRAGSETGAPSVNEKAAELAGVLARLPKNFSRESTAEILAQVVSADADWPRGTKKYRKPIEGFFDEAQFLLSLAAVKDGTDPLAEDWNWVRGHMTALLRLAQRFAARYAARKLEDGVLDFHDLEQFVLKLLWDFAADKPTPVAERWRGKFRFVFVDEYQDINAAQDKIIQSLSRDLECGDMSPLSSTRHVASSQSADTSAHSKGNRFLVGDVKQSIYRFRLADPKIFRDYARCWRGGTGAAISLAENFRSRAGLLRFVNSVFGLLMRAEIGGVNYDAEAELKPGAPPAEAPDGTARRDARSADSEPQAELLLRLKKGRAEVPDDGDDELADLDEAEKEARLLAIRLRELKDSGHAIRDDKAKALRAAEWGDMAVLLRSPAGKSEVFAKQFELAGVPLVVARGKFYESREILDLLSLLQLLDNPLQDVPAIAVLRSPLVGCSLDELAEIRLAAKHVPFWSALNHWAGAESGKQKTETAAKIARFLERHSRWRTLARQASLSQCLEEILAETHYADWLRTQPRGEQRCANVRQFLNLAQKFDEFQRQGLFRFLKFIAAQQEAEIEPEVPVAAAENAVRLMSIHQSKGLEFPVVAIADLAKPFNLQDLRGEIILDEDHGLCPRVQPPHTGARYPSLPHWLARRHQRRELLGEELRLLYVAMTRARDTLVLAASVSEKQREAFRANAGTVTVREIAAARSCADWLGLWFGVRSAECELRNETNGNLPDLRWRLVAEEDLPGKCEVSHPLPAGEMPGLDAATVEKLRVKLSWSYPRAAATRQAAKSSVTALRRAAAAADDEAEQVFPARTKSEKRKAESGKPKLSAAETGAAHHRFLQHVALEKAGDHASLAAEAQRLESENILSAEERTALDLGALADFWNSPPGRKIRAQPAAAVKRELAFTAKFRPAELAEIVGKGSPAGLEDEFVVVQGVADLVVLLPHEIWLLDFKTDEVRAGGMAEKTRIYTPQLKLYAAALAKIYSRPVSHCWLHFLAARKTVEI